MRPRTPAAWLGRRLARLFLKGEFDFEQRDLDAHIDSMAKEALK